MDTNGNKQRIQHLDPQELLLELYKIGVRMKIGIPREILTGEKRLALTPEAVAQLTRLGFRFLIETGAGLGINYADSHFAEAGATIVETPAETFQADLILKVQPPLPHEAAWMRPRSILISMLQLNRFTREALDCLMGKRITAVSYELLADEQQQHPLLDILSEIEGATAITIASELLSNSQGGKGILLGGIPGISPAEVVIIGADHAGVTAARLAMALGATVKVFDDDLNKLRQVQQLFGSHLFTSTFHPHVLQNAFRSADVVIGALDYLCIRHPYVISLNLVESMKRGAVIIDLRMNQGGCFETTRRFQETAECFEQFGVLHYCKTDISNRVARTTSMSFSNIFVPLLQTLIDYGSASNLIKHHTGFRAGIYLYQGKLVNGFVGNHFSLPTNPIDLYLSAY